MSIPLPVGSIEEMTKNLLRKDDATDRIIINSYEDCCFIDELCTNNINQSDYYDFLCGKLPLPHIEIEANNGMLKRPNTIEIKICGPDYVNVGENENVKKIPAVGIATVKAETINLEVSGILVKDDKWGIALLNNSKISSEDNYYAGELFSGFLTNYIGIQMALLHPEIKDVFSVKTTAVGDNGRLLSKKATKRQRVARYVKVRTINQNKLHEVQNKRQFTRKCQAWFVLGHWRQYKDGHRTFIQGYWKGPLREYKRNFDNVRIREVSKCN